ncbi:MAG TPA: ABC transporter substrate-binding protein, partial [Limnochordia bacterium]
MATTHRGQRRSVGAIALACLLALGLAAGATAAESITLGTLMALTGDLAAYGGPIQRATDLAAEHINAQGGLLDGRMLVLAHRDAQTNPQAGVDAAQKLVSID